MKKKGNLSTILLVIVLVIGLSLLLYPTFSDGWNSRVQSRAISHYSDLVSNMNQADYSHIWDDVRDYNASLVTRDNPYRLSDEQKIRYKQLLDLDGSGIMGYIEIPTLNQTIPVYHGTSNDVLNVAIGHLDWTSLPGGGEGTHTVLSGHRGLPSARLFTDLDKLETGDLFVLHILDQTLTYEVDQILVVEPQDTQALLIEEGKDLCTLVTCTPYGVNSHRMLVRGHRVENIEAARVVRVTADAMIIDKLVVAPFVLAPILLVMLVMLLIPKRKNTDD